ncbi:hypothetical protein [uncultured Polaribacter sp.]|uniref:hypothetical protein n=1 Tax=uncultured Polaribacter sp. TaxID=174711 RepID=UPI00261EE373|nr:hypothetical protein [uncultured Polaribacter sp.]
MKALFFTFILSLLAVNKTLSQTFFDQVKDKVWEGKGTLIGSPATFKMNWQKVLDNNFYKLEFKNQRAVKDKKITLKATAYYKVLSDSTFVGTWFDSRGITFPLKGKLSKNQLMVDWGTPETEVGKSLYLILESGQIKVTDFIRQKDKEFKFAEAFYNKKEK